MMRRLVEHGIECSYVLINSASHVMKHVSDVTVHGETDTTQKRDDEFAANFQITAR